MAVVIVGALSAFVPPDARAQEAKNSLFFELGGNAVLYSINYERRFRPNFTWRIGFMTFDEVLDLTAVPLTGSYLAGAGSHRLELGLGVELISTEIDASTSEEEFAAFDEEETTLAGTGIVGYRFQPQDGGFRFSIGVTPVFGRFGVLPWAGLSLGYTF